MSGFGKSTPRSWRRSPGPRSVPTRDDVADLEAEAERFRKLAPTFGYCSACGESVDEAKGKLHDAQCPYLPAERRKAAPPSGIALTDSDADAVVAVLCADDLAVLVSR